MFPFFETSTCRILIRLIGENSGPLPSLETSSQSTNMSNYISCRATAHRLLDKLIDHLEASSSSPLWTDMPEPVRQHLRSPASSVTKPTPIEAVCESVQDNVLPFGSGNTHHGFVGWVQGGGTINCSIESLCLLQS